MAAGDGLARHRTLSRYLLDGERVIVAMHQHWAKVAEPVASVAAGLVVVVWLDTVLPKGAWLLTNLAWWAWFAVVGRTLWRLLQWRHDLFIATDKRLLLTYGFLTHKVAMMPLHKVTDMSYTRSPVGRVLGYGQFLMESAGQDQALRKVSYVPHPDSTYRQICGQMFGARGPGPGGFHPYGGTASGGTTSDAGASRADDARAIPLPWAPYERDPGIGEADTGPITIWPNER
jgi:membrane protein YdbS with pleckstrin-like domain